MSNKIHKEIVKLVDKMVKHKLSRSNNHAFNVLIGRSISEVKKEVEYWESVYRMVEELKKRGFKLSHGGLNELLAVNRER